MEAVVKPNACLQLLCFGIQRDKESPTSTGKHDSKEGSVEALQPNDFPTCYYTSVASFRALLSYLVSYLTDLKSRLRLLMI